MVGWRRSLDGSGLSIRTRCWQIRLFVISRSIVICQLLQGVLRRSASKVCLVFEFGVKVETMQLCHSFECLFSLNEENVHSDAINLIMQSGFWRQMNTCKVPGRRRNHLGVAQAGRQERCGCGANMMPSQAREHHLLVEGNLSAKLIRCSN